MALMGPAGYLVTHTFPTIHNAWHTLVPDHVRQNKTNPGAPLLVRESVCVWVWVVG